MSRDERLINLDKAIEPPFISVITPFFNEERYLAQCIESVLSQSHSNFEYTLVDNQSTDKSGAIAAAYAARDSRIRVVRTPRSLTALQNLNFSLTHLNPSSPYCKLVFGDDWLYPHCLAAMIAVAEREPDIAIVGGCFMWEDTVAGRGLDTERSIFSGKEICRFFLLEGIFPFGSPSTVLYRTDILLAQIPFFCDTSLHPDTEAAFRVLANQKFGFVHEVASFMRMQAGSTTYSFRDFCPEALDRLIIVRKFGRLYLNDSEYEKVLQSAVKGFYRGLARQWLADRLGARKSGFWEHQARGLDSIGESIQPALLARHLPGGIVESLTRRSAFFRMRRDLLKSTHAALSGRH